MASAPPQDSPSSPPPPPSSDSPPPSSSESPPPSSPPPPPSSSAPPPTSSSSPPPSSSPPFSPPPPPSDGDGSTPPPPPDSNSPPPENSNPSPPPPPSSSSSSSPSPPPPPPSSSKSHHSPPPPRSLGPPSKGSSSSSSSSTPSSDNVTPIVVGVVVGLGVLLLLALLACMCCCKKKKKNKRSPHDHYMNQPMGAKAGGGYYASPPHGGGNWHNDPHVNLPPPPGGYGVNNGGWPSPPLPPPPVGAPFSSDLSSNFSGPHGPALPPPHPSMALGFTQSSFSYEELSMATAGFSQANLLGQGGFGYVHKGVLPNGKEIAVKSLKAGSGQGDREFQAEVEIISRVHHRHLVSLVGYCISGSQKLLVYEFVPNSTLEFHLHGKGRPTMDWATRLRIALGAARGLAYLHEDCHPRIIHRDIKAANILIDYNFDAKVADFGLAKLSQDNNTHVSTRVMGTFGYLAPEYASSGKLTEKSDVFSYGVMLLELITGRRPVDINSDMDESLVDWARPLCEKALEDGDYSKLADPFLEGNYVPHEMARMVACAGVSVRHSAKRRPKMSQIVRALEGDISLENFNEGMKPSRSSVFSSTDSSEFDNKTYGSDMRRVRKVVVDSTEYASSEFGHTSEYGLNPSSSSSEEMPRSGVANQRRTP